MTSPLDSLAVGKGGSDSDLDGFLRAMLRDGSRSPSAARSRAGDVVGGRYRLGELAGRGAMGSVHVATREGDGARVAVKLLRDSGADPIALERFRREARAAHMLEHPHIVRVLDFGVDGAQPFLVMELLEGETLGELLEREHRVPLARALEILGPVASALEAAHARGVVHRDVKPENVFLARREGATAPKLLDFGIAKLALGQKLTRSGTRLGTPAYMAPEQVRSSRTVDGACDQYALAVVLFELASGSLPHEAETPEAMLRAKVADPPRSLQEAAPELPAPLCDAVMRALSLDPLARFGSVADFWAAVRG